MATYQEILKAAGLTDEQITAATSNPAIGKAFESMMTQAEQKESEGVRKLQAAEQKEKDVKNFWDNTATKQIDEVFSASAKKDAEIAFYKTQAEKAKELGYIPSDAPGYEAGKRGPDGKFVTGTGEVPGSPGVSKEYIDKVGGDTVSAFWAAQDIQAEYQHLYGQPLLNMQQHAADARARGMNLRAHVEDKFGFQKRRDEMVATKQKEHDDKIRLEATDAAKKDFAEKYGSNPDARTPVASSFSKYKKTGTGQMDRLAWSKNDKRAVHESLKSDALKAEVVN